MPSIDTATDVPLHHQSLRVLIDRKGITPYAVAKQAGCSTNTIYGLLGDHERPMSWQVLARLCAALDCQPGDLLAFSPLSPEPTEGEV